MPAGELYIPHEVVIKPKIVRDPKTGHFKPGGGYDKGYFDKLPQWEQERRRQISRTNMLKLHKEGRLSRNRFAKTNTSEEVRKWSGVSLIMLLKDGTYKQFPSAMDAAEYVLKKLGEEINHKRTKDVSKQILYYCCRNKSAGGGFSDYNTYGYRWYYFKDKEIWVPKLGIEFSGLKKTRKLNKKNYKKYNYE